MGTTTCPVDCRPLEVGDIMECSWGYDQTNVDYYQVIAVSKTGRVKLAGVRSWMTEDRGSGYTKVAPDAGRFTGDETGYKVPRYYQSSRWNHELGRSVATWEATVTINSYSSAHRVDRFSSTYETAAGWGH